MGAEDALDRAASVLIPARKILVYTGAGISTESGIPDFRGPHGLWSKVDPDDFSISRYLTSRDVRVRRWKMHQEGELWGVRSNVKPNPAHFAVAALNDAGRMVGCITQNIDGLHQAAGLPDDLVAEVHGNIRKSTCIKCGAGWPTEKVLERVDAGDDDPLCPTCGDLIKPTTVLFGEILPQDQVDRALGFAMEADAVLAIGTTMSVYPAVEFPLIAVGRGCPLVIINIGDTEHDHRATVKIEGKAGTYVPQLVEMLAK